MRTLLAALLVCSATSALAFQPDLATLAVVPRVELPRAAVDKALAAPVRGQPYRYAVPVDLALASRQGLWRSEDGIASWRLRLHSEGARSLSLHFARVGLPAGAELWTYDPRAHVRHGPYDATRLGDTGLWTPPVGGDELVIEVRMPDAKAGPLELGPVRAFHGFRGWSEPAKAGACNIDITCAEAADWVTDAGSVARISIGGAFLCTGQLINNVRQDKTRFFLTANHCGVGTADGPPESVIFYFNYTGPCGDGVDNPPPAPTFQGSVLLARDTQSDFALLRITDSAPLPAGTYFAGWDATGVASSGGVAIHHPAGDEKKIAFHDATTVEDTIDIGGACAIDAWRVNWNDGTTEAGSSGGGLWNASHRIIGVLTGGFASCANPTAADFFGRLDRAWTAAPQANGQLKAHLDPDGTCVAVVPGLDPAASPGPVAPTPENQVCSGPASNCSGGGGGGGAPDPFALALLLALGVRRRLQHHQQHARDRDR